MSAPDPREPLNPSATGEPDAAQRLLTLLAAHGGHHLEKVLSDLDQTEALLAEAIERLCANFQALADAAAQGSASLNTALDAGDHAAARASAAQTAQALRVQVNAAVASLQFHDLSSQLMARARSRVDGVRAMLSVCDMAHGQSQEQTASAVADVLASSEKLDRDLHQGVRQRQMDSGDIELF